MPVQLCDVSDVYPRSRTPSSAATKTQQQNRYHQLSPEQKFVHGVRRRGAHRSTAGIPRARVTFRAIAFSVGTTATPNGPFPGMNGVVSAYLENRNGERDPAYSHSEQQDACRGVKQVAELSAWETADSAVDFLAGCCMVSSHRARQPRRSSTPAC